MVDTTRDSERLIEEGRRLRDDNRAGGRHRLGGSIGKGSSALRTRHYLRKLRNVVIAVFGIFVAASIAGLVLDGLGFAGVMMTVLAAVVATFVFAQYPRMKVPQRAELTKGDVRQMVGRTELWLEHQRRHLPREAVAVVERLGGQLDALGRQLEKVPAEHEVARDIRKLVGETLPEMVDSYVRIPEHLRREKRSGVTPDEQLTQSLEKISREIDSITRQLAQGSLDDLAITHRYLDYKYGEGVEAAPDTGVPLPDFEQQKSPR